MEILLVRHGKTHGNRERRYGGRTDEPILPAAAAALEQSVYRDFHPDLVYVSPMLRCRETAGILFPECACKMGALSVQTPAPSGGCSPRRVGLAGSSRENRMMICRGLRETDFGAFEYKTYDELKDDPAYQAWLDSGGTLACPGGEAGTDFRMRCRDAFLACLRHAGTRGAKKTAFVTHGGVIMSIMDAYARPQEDFYHWQVPNGCGYHVCMVKGENEFFLRIM